jgi:hypothetical protein
MVGRYTVCWVDCAKMKLEDTRTCAGIELSPGPLEWLTRLDEAKRSLVSLDRDIRGWAAPPKGAP